MQSNGCSCSQLLLCSTSAEDAEVTVENLNDVVECALTQPLYRSQMKKLTVSLSTNEYKNCRAYFSHGKYNESTSFCYMYICYICTILYLHDFGDRTEVTDFARMA